MTSRSVYRLVYREGYEWLLPQRPSDFETLRFDGRSRAHDWEPVRMSRLTETEAGQPLTPSDFPACSGGDMLMISGRTRTLLADSLAGCCEILPLACFDGDFSAINVTHLEDVLDEVNSDLLRATDTGELLRIRKHAFRTVPTGIPLFKLATMKRGLIYATEDFAVQLDRSGLIGLALRPA